MCEEKDKLDAIENFKNYDKDYINPVIRRWVAQGRPWSWIFVASYTLEPELLQKVEINSELDKIVDEEVRFLNLDLKERYKLLGLDDMISYHNRQENIRKANSKEEAQFLSEW